MDIKQILQNIYVNVGITLVHIDGQCTIYVVFMA